MIFIICWYLGCHIFSLLKRFRSPKPIRNHVWNGDEATKQPRFALEWFRMISKRNHNFYIMYIKNEYILNLVCVIRTWIIQRFVWCVRKYGPPSESWKINHDLFHHFLDQFSEPKSFNDSFDMYECTDNIQNLEKTWFPYLFIICSIKFLTLKSTLGIKNKHILYLVNAIRI